ncbi:MAG: hypothetical protein QOJ79_3374 [Actinomycetota bacterium]|jgi:prepilin-type N-terminal cleavage/methylation domain-containing protein|nr:hypothetical protein [Actinomycetota bacterium]
MPFRARLRADRDRGFTLIEMLVVILLLGTLAAIAVLATTKFRKSSTTSACTTDVRSDMLALDQYKTKYSQYATSTSTLTTEKLINNLEESSAYKITYAPNGTFTDYTLTVKVPETEAGAAPGDILTKDSTQAAIKTACTG